MSACSPFNRAELNVCALRPRRLIGIRRVTRNSERVSFGEEHQWRQPAARELLGRNFDACLVGSIPEGWMRLNWAMNR